MRLRRSRGHPLPGAVAVFIQGSGNVDSVMAVIHSPSAAMFTRCPRRSIRRPPASNASAPNAISVPSSSSTLPLRVSPSYAFTVACMAQSLVRGDGQEVGHGGGVRAHAELQRGAQVLDGVDVAPDAGHVIEVQLAGAALAVPGAGVRAEPGGEGHAGAGGV